MKEFHKEIHEISHLAKGAFSDSAILEENQDFYEKDVQKVKSFLVDLLKEPSSAYQSQNKDNKFLEHLFVCAEIAGQITIELKKQDAEKFFFLSPSKMEIVGLLHDFGRLISHSFYTTDKLTSALFKEIGISQNIVASLHTIDWYWNLEKPLDLSSMSVEQMISVISDVLAKRHSQNPSRLRRPHEVLKEVVQGKQKYLQSPEKNEQINKMVKALDTYTDREQKTLIYILSWFEKQNVDLAAIVENTEKNLNNLFEGF